MDIDNDVDAKRSLCLAEKERERANWTTIRVDTNLHRESLVGLQIRLWWGGNHRYFKGTVTDFNSSTREHTVMYDDGEVRKERLAHEDIQVEQGANVVKLDVLLLPETSKPECGKVSITDVSSVRRDRLGQQRKEKRKQPCLDSSAQPAGPQAPQLPAACPGSGSELGSRPGSPTSNAPGAPKRSRQDVPSSDPQLAPQPAAVMSGPAAAAGPPGVGPGAVQRSSQRGAEIASQPECEAGKRGGMEPTQQQQQQQQQQLQQCALVRSPATAGQVRASPTGCVKSKGLQPCQQQASILSYLVSSLPRERQPLQQQQQQQQQQEQPLLRQQQQQQLKEQQRKEQQRKEQPRKEQPLLQPQQQQQQERPPLRQQQHKQRQRRHQKQEEQEEQEEQGQYQQEQEPVMHQQGRVHQQQQEDAPPQQGRSSSPPLVAAGPGACQAADQVQAATSAEHCNGAGAMTEAQDLLARSVSSPAAAGPSDGADLEPAPTAATSAAREAAAPAGRGQQPAAAALTQGRGQQPAAGSTEEGECFPQALAPACPLSMAAPAAAAAAAAAAPAPSPGPAAGQETSPAAALVNVQAAAPVAAAAASAPAASPGASPAAWPATAPKPSFSHRTAVASNPATAARRHSNPMLPRPLAATSATASGRLPASGPGSKVQYAEVDVALTIDPSCLLGLPIKVYWPLDRQYYEGRAVAFDPDSCRHRVEYADGDSEERVLAVDKVMVGLPGAGLQGLRRPSAQQLRALAAAVAREADGLELGRKSARQVGALRIRATSLEAAASAVEEQQQQQQQQAGPTPAPGPSKPARQPGPRREKPALPLSWRVAARDSSGQALPLMLGDAEAAETEARLAAAWRSFQRTKAGYPQFRELDLGYHLSPQALVGRQLRVHWPDDGAWFLGHVAEYNEDTGQHVVAYVDGDKEVLYLAAEEVRLLVHAGERVPVACAAVVRGVAEKMGEAGRALQRRAAEGEGGEDAEGCAARLLGKAAEMARAADTRQELEQQGLLESEPTPASLCETVPGADPQPEPAPVPEGQGSGEGDVDVDVEEGEAFDPHRLAPGDPAWVCLKGHTPWPCTVISPEEALRLGVCVSRSVISRARAACKQQLYVSFFGDYAAAAVTASAVLPLAAGLRRRLHNPALAPGSGRGGRFRRALLELQAYLGEGELPRGMLPDNNDDVFARDSDSEGEQDDGSAAAADDDRPAAGRPPLQLPVKVSATLTLLSLGRVDWLNPLWHTERFVFPEGFRVSRLACTPASGKREVPHVMEVARGADGLRPVFRVTPEGGPTLEGASPTAAFGMLWDCDPGSRGKSVQRSGHEAFGFMHQVIVRLIQGLPGTERCEKYCDWPGGRRAAVPALTAEEQLRRTAVLASLQALPPGVAPRPARAALTWECDVCGEDSECEGSLMLHCDLCRLCVHMDCVGEEREPDGGLWLCDVCTLRRVGAAAAPPCALCPVVGGPMKRTTDGRWAHLVCAMWVPEAGFVDPDRREPIEGVEKVTAARRKLLCCFCRQPYGAPIQCAGGRGCFTAFHPLCARDAGMAMVMEASVDRSGGAEDELGPQGERDGAVSEGVEKRVLRELPPAGQLAPVPPQLSPLQQQQLAAAGAKGRRPRHRAGAGGRAWEEGTRAGSHQLLCFCSKHTGLAAAEPGRKRIYTLLQEELRRQDREQAAAEPPPQPGGEEARAAPQGEEDARRKPAAAAAGGGGDGGGGGTLPEAIAHPYGSARCIPLASRRSRGPREPDSIARAEAKRLYVQRMPYLVTGCLRRNPLPVPPLQRRPLPLAGPEVQDGMDTAASGPAPEQQSSEAVQLPLSMAERYRAMQASMRLRLTVGKSAIHGLGAIAKAPLAAGDMVIEYVGELIRPSVADARERALYDRLVGCGTYVFRLSEGLCVDATRAGNLAHVLNHSCEPNCVSRTISVRRGGGEGPVEDHVIIFAKRGIRAGEELTYDYRFNGSEKLPCNCGAAACRGFVNVPEEPGGGDTLLVPRAQLLAACRPAPEQQRGCEEAVREQE